MAETKKPEAAAAVPPASVNHRPTITRQALGAPIVLEYKRSKKKKKGTSKQFRDVQRTEARLAKVSEKAARAIAKGAEVYNDARKKSANNKQDGALRDFAPNLAEGLSESIRRASTIPVDVAEALDTKTARGLLRNQLRMVRNGLRLWRP